MAVPCLTIMYVTIYLFSFCLASQILLCRRVLHCLQSKSMQSPTAQPPYGSGGRNLTSQQSKLSTTPCASAPGAWKMPLLLPTTQGKEGCEGFICHVLLMSGINIGQEKPTWKLKYWAKPWVFHLLEASALVTDTYTDTDTCWNVALGFVCDLNTEGSFSGLSLHLFCSCLTLHACSQLITWPSVIVASLKHSCEMVLASLI